MALAIMTMTMVMVYGHTV